MFKTGPVWPGVLSGILHPAERSGMCLMPGAAAPIAGPVKKEV